MLKTKTQSTAYNLITDKDMTYSYAETKTGSTWVDGKPIYRRVFKVTNKSLSSGTVVQGFARSGFSEIIRIYAYLCGSDGGHIPFTRVGSSGKGSSIEYSFANNGFIFMGNDNWSAQSSRWLMIIAEYTK